MKYGAFTVNIEKIAQGIFSMAKETEEGKACLILGMIPSHLIRASEKFLKAKIPDTYLCRETMEEHNGKRQREQIMQSISSRVYDLAAEQGICKLD